MPNASRRFTAAGYELRRGGVDVVDQPIGFICLLRCEDDLGVAVGKPQTGLTDRNVAPRDFVPKCPT